MNNRNKLCLLFTACKSFMLAAKVNLTYTVLQACSDAVRFLDERKAGMLALLERSVRDAAGQHKVVSRTACMLPPQTCSCAIVSCSS